MAPLFAAVLTTVRHAFAGSGAGMLTTVQHGANGAGVALIGGVYYAVEPVAGDTGALLAALLDASLPWRLPCDAQAYEPADGLSH